MGLQDRLTRDHVGGVLMAAVGVAVAVAASGYEIGSLRSMNSGFFPLVLGVLLALVGGAVVVTTPLRSDPEAAAAAGASASAAVDSPSSHGDAGAAPPPPSAHAALLDVRGWACILGGLLAFVLLGEHGGLVPASFAAVFIAAMGDRTNRPRHAAALALVMTAFGVLVFHFGLHVLLPLFVWR